MGDMLQSPPMEAWNHGSTEPYIYYVFFYMYVPMIIFDL